MMLVPVPHTCISQFAILVEGDVQGPTDVAVWLGALEP
jgi:hypothetical protein